MSIRRERLKAIQMAAQGSLILILKIRLPSVAYIGMLGINYSKYNEMYYINP